MIRTAEGGRRSLTVNRDYVPFLDWFKCLGIAVIVYGHIGWGPLRTLPPILAKQLGVALFVFVTGYTLAREKRERWHVAFNRLFEVYLFGITLALLLSVTSYATGGRLLISNYLPFLGGANVAFDFFPANPTTWYLGTYLQIIVVWALALYRVRVSFSVLVCALLGEIVVRALLMRTAGYFVAYMALPNWSTVFLLGSWYGQRATARTRLSDLGVWPAILGLVAGVAFWVSVTSRAGFDLNFPFALLPNQDPVRGALFISALVSAAYLGFTWLAFGLCVLLPAPPPVRFFARNTLIVFLAHMPLIAALLPFLNAWGFSRPLRSALLLIICLPVLACLSEMLRRSVRPQVLRDQLWARLQRSTGGPRLRPLAMPAQNL
jgi:hypothetical protein